jgi:hypothetical protein
MSCEEEDTCHMRRRIRVTCSASSVHLGVGFRLYCIIQYILYSSLIHFLHTKVSIYSD